MSSDSTPSALLDPELLLERYGERIYRLARRMTNNDADAEDAMQNTIILILKNAGSYRGVSFRMGWIYSIRIYEAREIHRKRMLRRAVCLYGLQIDFDE